MCIYYLPCFLEEFCSLNLKNKLCFILGYISFSWSVMRWSLKFLCSNRENPKCWMSVSILDQLWLFCFYSQYGYNFLFIDMHGINWLDAKHCEFHLTDAECLWIPINIRGLCSGTQLNYFETVWSLQGLL